MKEITLWIDVPNDNLAGVVTVIQAAVNAAPASLSTPDQGPLREARVGGRALNPATFNAAHP